MAGKTIYNPGTLGEPVGPFSRAVRIGDILYIAGTSAITHQSGPIWDRPLSSDFEEQARLTYQNIGNVLEDARATWDDVYKTTVLLKDRKYFDLLGRVRTDFLPNKEYVSTAFICELIRDDMLIEVDVEAYVAGK